MNPPFVWLLCALVLGVLAWGMAQVFDREPAKTMPRYLLAKVLPLSLTFAALGLGVIGVVGLFVE